jgi:hypothetical protein
MDSRPPESVYCVVITHSGSAAAYVTCNVLSNQHAPSRRLRLPSDNANGKQHCMLAAPPHGPWTLSTADANGDVQQWLSASCERSAAVLHNPKQLPR